MGPMTEHVLLGRWLADYEAAWRAPATDSLGEIFTDDASYLHSPTGNRRGAYADTEGVAAKVVTPVPRPSAETEFQPMFRMEW
jgi:hypothetical protein